MTKIVNICKQSYRILAIRPWITQYMTDCYIFGRWVLHITPTVTYLHEERYISGQLWHIHTMSVTYMDDCYISARWVLHIWMTVIYLPDKWYISGRHLHIRMMGVTFLDDYYIIGRWVLYIWTVTYHTSRGHAVLMDWMTLVRVPIHIKEMREIARA